MWALPTDAVRVNDGCHNNIASLGSGIDERRCEWNKSGHFSGERQTFFARVSRPSSKNCGRVCDVPCVIFTKNSSPGANSSLVLHVGNRNLKATLPILSQPLEDHLFVMRPSLGPCQ